MEIGRVGQYEVVGVSTSGEIMVELEDGNRFVLLKLTKDASSTTTSSDCGDADRDSTAQPTSQLSSRQSSKDSASYLRRQSELNTLGVKLVLHKTFWEVDVPDTTTPTIRLNKSSPALLPGCIGDEDGMWSDGERGEEPETAPASVLPTGHTGWAPGSEDPSPPATSPASEVTSPGPDVPDREVVEDVVPQTPVPQPEAAGKGDSRRSTLGRGNLPMTFFGQGAAPGVTSLQHQQAPHGGKGKGKNSAAPMQHHQEELDYRGWKGQKGGNWMEEGRKGYGGLRTSGNGTYANNTRKADSTRGETKGKGKEWMNPAQGGGHYERDWHNPRLSQTNQQASQTIMVALRGGSRWDMEEAAASEVLGQLVYGRSLPIKMEGFARRFGALGTLREFLERRSDLFSVDPVPGTHGRRFTVSHAW